MSARRDLVLLVAILVLASACGSTVKDHAGGRELVSEFGNESASLDGSSTVGGGSTRSAGLPAGARSSAQGSGSTAAPPAGARSSAQGSGSTAAPPAGVSRQEWLPAGPGANGVTDKTIKLGFWSSDVDAAAVGRSFGGDAYPSTFDYDNANRAAVEAVNALGGIAGRKVEPVVFRATRASVSAQDSIEQACAHWTEDNHVFAFFLKSGGHEAALECAAKKKTPWVRASSEGMWPSERRFNSMAPYYYAPAGSVADRRDRALVKFLHSKGFFSKGAKVALMIEDAPSLIEGAEKGMKPALAAAGIKPEVEIVYPDPMQSPWANYILQFQSAGVTHVLFATTTSPFGLVFMMRAAEDQRYRPFWGVGSDMTPQVHVALGGPVEQLARVRGMGWQPHWDTKDRTPQSVTSQVCHKALQRVGADESSWHFGEDSCEFVFFLKEAFKHADELSPMGLAAGVARLGDGYPSTRAIRGVTRFGPGRHYGATIVRMVQFDREANVFKYTTPEEPFPE